MCRNLYWTHSPPKWCAATSAGCLGLLGTGLDGYTLITTSRFADVRVRWVPGPAAAVRHGLPSGGGLRASGGPARQRRGRPHLLQLRGGPVRPESATVWGPGRIPIRQRRTGAAGALLLGATCQWQAVVFVAGLPTVVLNGGCLN